MAGCACGVTSITAGTKRIAEEAGSKALNSALGKLLQQAPMGAHTPEQHGSKTSRAVEEATVLLI